MQAVAGTYFYACSISGSDLTEDGHERAPTVMDGTAMEHGGWGDYSSWQTAL